MKANKIKRFIIYIYQRVIIRKNIKIKFFSNEKTIQKIIKEKKSLIRYGDGEFLWMWGIKQNSFQENNAELSKKLKEAFYNKNENIIVGLPSPFVNTKGLNIYAKEFYTNFITKYYDKLNETINFNKTYADTTITRPYIDYRKKDYNQIKDRFNRLKKIWEGREVIIVEGEYTRFGRGNDLMDNAKSIRRIICPAKNAFRVYKKIESEILKQKKDKLFLIALGPTATIIGYDMANKGYQCIDIGHADVEYMWFQMGAKKKTEIKGKYVNEAPYNNLNDEKFNDKEYDKQIIERIQ